jgi:hypothetical protein
VRWEVGQAGAVKQRMMLGVLALTANTLVHRDALVDAVWGEDPPATAAHLVQSYVSGLRRALVLAGPAGPRRPAGVSRQGGESFAVIARRLGKAVSTVSREVAANGGRGCYRAWRAHQRAREQARRPKEPKLAHPRLAAQVTSWLTEWWSPVQISGGLRIDYPGDPMMWVSHETIYQALYVQGRGELRRELARCLRTGRATRRPRGCGENTGQIRDMVMISERPAEAAGPGRARPLGRRPDHRRQPQVRGGHASRADQPVRPAAAPARRP